MKLLKVLPERYKYHENKEQEIRKYLGKDVSILTETYNKIKKPITLKDLRERSESGEQFDMFEIGGCGCFVDDDS